MEEAHAALQSSDDEGASAMLQYAALAEGGFELAQANVAFLLDQQYTHHPNVQLLGMRGDTIAERALHMYKHAASQGNIEAEVKLGDYAYYGLGMATDLEASVAHYRTAADTRSRQIGVTPS